MSCFQIKSYLQALGVRINSTYLSGTIVQPSRGRLPTEGLFQAHGEMGIWWAGEHLAEPCFSTIARAPQECRVLWRGQGEDECRGADGPDETAPEWLHEGKAEEPTAASQPSP